MVAKKVICLRVAIWYLSFWAEKKSIEWRDFIGWGLSSRIEPQALKDLKSTSNGSFSSSPWNTLYSKSGWASGCDYKAYRVIDCISHGVMLRGLDMRWSLSGRPLSNGFLHGGKWSLGRIWGSNSESIDEVFASHVDFTALNPMRPFGDSMAEFTALPIFFSCCWCLWPLFKSSACLLLAWHAVMLLADEFHSPSERVAGCLPDSRMPGEHGLLPCWQVFLVLATGSDIAISQLPSKIFRIRACNNGVFARRLGCSLNPR